MAYPLSDTAPDAMEVLLDLYRRMTPAQKLRRVRDLTLASNQLVLAGLHTRHPDESEPDLLLRLARIHLGDAVVAQAYGTRGA